MEEKTITLDLPKSITSGQTLIYLAFLIPLFISGPQLLTGTIVNALLFVYAYKLNGRKNLAIIMAPSIGALLNGILFGKFTLFLVYFLPFVWIGNFILISLFQLFLKQKGFLQAIVFSSFLKSLALFIVAVIFTQFKIGPMIFLQAMGVFQFLSAIFGGVLSFGIIKLAIKR